MSEIVEIIDRLVKEKTAVLATRAAPEVARAVIVELPVPEDGPAVIHSLPEVTSTVQLIFEVMVK